LLNQKLKSTITVKQYTRDGSIRKVYAFKGVFPTNTEGYTLTYGDQDFLVKTVTFGYTNYTVTTQASPYVGDINVPTTNLA